MLEDTQDFSVDLDRVRGFLEEDIGSGDCTAALIDAKVQASADVITREDMVLAGQAWFDAVFSLVDPVITVSWQHRDGEQVTAGQSLCRLQGPARALLSGERTALNLLQTLSATASVTRRYVDAVAGSGVVILDTRKTLPGLRLAQKYAVRCGGGQNHRMGLYDAILIKENHIKAAGSIAAAVQSARERYPNIPLEVEVEDLAELEQALQAGAPRLLLDNFSVAGLAEAVQLTAGRARLEASGNMSLASIAEVARTGVDFISIGAITKHVAAIDLSMRIDLLLG